MDERNGWDDSSGEDRRNDGKGGGVEQRHENEYKIHLYQELEGGSLHQMLSLLSGPVPPCGGDNNGGGDYINKDNTNNNNNNNTHLFRAGIGVAGVRVSLFGIVVVEHLGNILQLPRLVLHLGRQEETCCRHGLQHGGCKTIKKKEEKIKEAKGKKEEREKEKKE